MHEQHHANASRTYEYVIRSVHERDAEAASVLVRKSFLTLASQSWESVASHNFFRDSAPEILSSEINAAFYAVAAFAEDCMLGFLLMSTPARLDWLFVHPNKLRQRIATTLWDNARFQIETEFPELHTVELTSTPYAISFYKKVGFVPISTEFTYNGARGTHMACWLPARALGAELIQMA